MDKKAIGKRILQARLSKGVRQKELAKTLGVSHSTLSRIETGSVLPTVKLLLRFREEFNISIEWILTGEEPTVSIGDGEGGEGVKVGEYDELTIVFEEMKKDKALKYLILSTFYFFRKLINQDETITANGKGGKGASQK